MTMIAKAVMPGKFWIVEDPAGQRKGALQAIQGGKILATFDGDVKTYDSYEMAEDALGLSASRSKEDQPDVAHEVEGYPTNCTPYNSIWDVKKKLPLFTKTEKSKSLHAAGYYIVKFEHGWVHSHCPKLTTLTKNEWQGPFKNKLEMRERLRLADD